jgi:chromosome segregation ATPase
MARQGTQRALPLSDMQEHMLLRVAEKYEKEDGTMQRGAYQKIAEETTLIVGYDASQVRGFLRTRKATAGRKRQKIIDEHSNEEEALSATKQALIKDCYAYNKPKEPISIHEVVRIQRQELKDVLHQLQAKERELQQKQDEVQKNTKRMEEIMGQVLVTKKKIKSSEELNARLQAELETQSQNVRSLGEDVMKIKTSESHLQVRVKAKQAECEALEKKIEEIRISGETKLCKEQEQKLARVQNELEDEKQGVLKLHKVLREKEAVLSSQQSQLQNQKKKWEEDSVSRKEEMKKMERDMRHQEEVRRRLQQDVEFLERELEEERARADKYDDWNEVEEHAYRMAQLEDDLKYYKEWSCSLRSENKELRASVGKLQYDVHFYRRQLDDSYRSQSYSHQSVEYYRHECDKKDREIMELKEQLCTLQQNVTIGADMRSIMWRATKLENILKWLIQELVDAEPVKTALLRSHGLSVKLRFIGQFCFMLANRKCAPGESLFFNIFIKKWDFAVRKFCEVRNDVTHEHRYLDDMTDDARKKVVDEYLQRYDELYSSVEALEGVVENKEDLKQLLRSEYPNDSQKRSRLAAILKNFDSNG